MRNKTTNIYTEWLPLIENLSDEDAGKIFKYILKYQSGEDINSKHAVWQFLKSKIDDYNSKYENIVETRRNAGKKGGLAKASKSHSLLSKSSNKIKENKIKENKIKENIFKPPTLEEVKSYAEERKRTDLAVKFFEFYTAGEWKDSKSNPVRNWKQKFLTWEGREPPPPKDIKTGGNYSKLFSMTDSEKAEYFKKKGLN